MEEEVANFGTKQPELHEFVLSMIGEGHTIPFDKTPMKLFRKANPPSLAADIDKAWVSIRGDIKHGAIAPVDIKKEGMPTCVCSVLTADKQE